MAENKLYSYESLISDKNLLQVKNLTELYISDVGKRMRMSSLKNLKILHINNYNDEAVTLQVLNSLGEVLIEEALSSSHSKLNIQHLISGMYFIKISQKEKHSVMKFIKE